MALGSACYGSVSEGSGNAAQWIENYLMIAFPGSLKLQMGTLPVEVAESEYDKFGYVNNPRFTETPASESEHKPCGYWFKGDGKAQKVVWTLPK